MVDAFSDNFGNFINELNNIANKGRFDVAPKLNPVKPKTINMSMPSLGGVTRGGGISSLDKLMRAIKQQESSGNYGAVNKDSGAMGGYQILPSNIAGTGKGWDYEALGRDISTQQFLSSPQLQDQIARYKLNQYLKKYGTAGAAVAWYGGPGAVPNMHSKTTQTGGYPSLYAYWTSVLNKM